MTALPIIETQSNDISAYIPTNVISITDGQIFLESDLFNAGVRPAVNAGISVSRVGGHAQIKAMRQVSGTLRIDLAQYREKEAFSMFASELDPETVRQLKKGGVMVELLKQDKNVPMPVEDQVVVLYAGAGDFLMELPVERVPAYQTQLLDVMHLKHADLMEQIRQLKELTPELRKGLDEAIGEFTKGFLYAPASGN